MGKKKAMPAIAEPKAREVVKSRPSSEPKKPSREGTVGKQFYIDEELAAALDEYTKSFGDVRVTQTSIFETALKAYLASKGHWPRKK